MQDFSTGQTAFMINWFNRSDSISAAAPQLEYGYLPVPNGPNTQDSGRYYSQGPLGECFYLLKNPQNTTEDYSCILKVMKELYRPVYGKGWEQETALWESEVANYAKDEDMLEMCNLLVDSTFYPAHLKYANMEHLVVQDTVVSVSYTHLDVYKRQAHYRTLHNRLSRKAVLVQHMSCKQQAVFMAVIPVSYTHLDVYKRQA